MRFGLVHRVMTDLLATLGVLAVVTTAQMSPWTDAALLAGLVAALAIPESWQSKPFLRHVSTLGPLALLAIEITRFVLGHPALDIAVEFAALLQIVRIATRRGAAHDQQIIVLALLHFVAGTVLGGGLSYGLCFVGFLVVAPGALVLSHLRREVEGNYRQGARDRTGLPVDVPRILRSRRVVGRQFLAATCLLSIPIFLFTAVLFIAFPRVGLSLLLLNRPHSGRMIGFSDHVDLGQIGVLRDDPSIALRFTPENLPDNPPARMTLRLRGTAFDSYDGHAWKRTLTERQPATRGSDAVSIYRYPDVARDKRITFDLEPIDPPVIFLPPRVVGLRVRNPSQSLLGEPLTIYRGPEGEFRYGGAEARGLHYEAFLASEGEGLAESMPPVDRPRYLALGPEITQRITDLAHEWTDAFPTSAQKAHALEDHLRHDYHYDRNSPSGAAKQPLDDFLFVSRRGHCEFFSSAMAVMLREIGIPSRNVTGFVGGSLNRFGNYYAVREGDAHSWVEAYIEDIPHPTWTTFDPTPSAGAQPLGDTTSVWARVRDFLEYLSQRWNRYVIQYDLQKQWQLFDTVSRQYDSIRKTAGLDKGALEHATRPPILALGTLTLLLAGYAIWKRRRNANSGAPLAKAEPPNRNVEAATLLYRTLETALALNGMPRPVSLPPLRHAEELRARHHPLGNEIVELTNVYLEARFGGARIDETKKRDFERRVRAIRSWRQREESAEA